MKKTTPVLITLLAVAIGFCLWQPTATTPSATLKVENDGRIASGLRTNSATTGGYDPYFVRVNQMQMPPNKNP